MTKWFGGNSLFNGNFVAETIVIGGNRVPVNNLDDEELSSQARATHVASNRRAARLYFGMLLFVLEFQLSAKFCGWLLGPEQPVANRVTVFALVTGLMAVVTLGLMSGWLRRNFTVMRRHHKDHAVAIAELDRRRQPADERNVPPSWAEFRRRARAFFYE